MIRLPKPNVFKVGQSGEKIKQSGQYTNKYGHERLWLKLWARGDCNYCAILLRGAAPKQNSTIAVTEGPLVLTERLE